MHANDGENGSLGLNGGIRELIREFKDIYWKKIEKFGWQLLMCLI